MHYSFKSTPTWTLKSRTQTITQSNQTVSRPGPHDYNVKKPLPQSATIARTNSKRQLYGPIQSFPAPGAYEAKSYITAGVKRSMSARYVDYTKRTPGPHDYDNNTLKVKNQSPGYTMAPRSKSYREIVTDNNKHKPAPTSYDSFKGSFVKHNKTVIGTSERKDLTETQKTPAPNYYNAEKAEIYSSTKNPRCAFGGQFRNTAFGQKQVTPGPAYYDKRAFVQENKQHKKGYSCRNKTIDLIAESIAKFPAPGQYQSHLKNKSRGPRIANPQSPRKTFMDDMQDFKMQYPGPGFHSPKLTGTKYQSTQSHLFSKSNRKNLYQNQKTPGPNEYINDKMNILFAAPKFSVTKTIAKNQFLQVNPQNPAPGQYDPSLQQVKNRSVAHQVPREKRPDFEKHRYTPSPGSYDLRGKEQGPTWVFNRQKRVAFTDKKNEGKGGLIYEIPGMVPNPPSYMKVKSKVNYESPIKSQYQSTGFTGKK